MDTNYSNTTIDKLASDTNQQEGPLTKAIEKQTAKIPSVAYLGLAGGAFALSLGLAATRREKGLATFVGLWVPSLLLLGIYNKIVKTEGSDKQEQQNLIH
jgi:hypothetical protein